jgi:putative hydrolase of the HAD superfamily
MTSAVWTDFGGVLTPPVAETLHSFCASVGIPVDIFTAAMRMVAAELGTDDAMAPLDTPLIGQRDWERRITAAAAQLGWTGELTDFPRQWFAGRPANAAWLTTLAGLRERGVFVGLLSNMPPAWDEHWRRMMDAEATFDDLVLSAEVGMRKPQPAIFELAAARCGRPPERCVLVDDLAGNCAAAEQAGWHAVHFRTAAQAAAELAALVGPATVGSAR